MPSNQLPLKLALLLGLSAALIALGSILGSTGIDWNFADANHTILYEIRLPRSIGAFLAGALLGLAGAIAQSLFRNPLADPYLLGSASGALLGVELSCASLMLESIHSSP
jgi:iron complex transport system permease protein